MTTSSLNPLNVVVNALDNVDARKLEHYLPCFLILAFPFCCASLNCQPLLLSQVSIWTEGACIIRSHCLNQAH